MRIILSIAILLGVVSASAAPITNKKSVYRCTAQGGKELLVTLNYAHHDDYALTTYQLYVQQRDAQDKATYLNGNATRVYREGQNQEDFNLPGTDFVLEKLSSSSSTGIPARALFQNETYYCEEERESQCSPKAPRFNTTVDQAMDVSPWVFSGGQSDHYRLTSAPPWVSLTPDGYHLTKVENSGEVGEHCVKYRFKSKRKFYHSEVIVVVH